MTASLVTMEMIPLLAGDGDDDLIGGSGKDIFTCGKGEDIVHDFNELEGDLD